MNLQVISNPAGEILRMSGSLSGAVHDLTAARIRDIIRQFAAAGLIVLADKGYVGAGQHILTPYRGRTKASAPGGLQGHRLTRHTARRWRYRCPNPAARSANVSPLRRCARTSNVCCPGLHLCQHEPICLQ